MENLKYYTRRRYSTTLHISEIKPSPNVVLVPTMDDPNRRQVLSQLRNKEYEAEGYRRVAAINLAFFDNSVTKPYGLNYVDGKMHSYSWAGDDFLELIYQDGQLLIDDVDGVDFLKKYPRAKWGQSLSYTLVRGGRISLEKAERFPFANFVHPRTMLGQKKDGTIVMVVAQGRNGQVDRGLTARESAEVMLELDCEIAINADGGDSSEMILDNEIKNVLSGRIERPLANALLVMVKGPYTIQGETNDEDDGSVKQVKVTASTLNARSGPGTTYKIIHRYSLGTVVDVLNVSGDWLKTPQGWIHGGYTEKYEAPKPPEAPSAPTPPAPPTTDNLRQYREITATLLNIRNMPSMSGSVVGQYTQRTIVQVLKEQNGWYATDRGWISSAHTKVHVPPAPAISEKYIVLAQTLNIRSGPGTNYAIAGRYAANDIIEVIQKSGDWVKTDKGWVHGDYAKRYILPEKKPLKTVEINIAALNIRSGPGTNFSKLSFYKRGESVDVFDIKGDWLKTEKGWIHGGYTKDLRVHMKPQEFQYIVDHVPASKNRRPGKAYARYNFDWQYITIHNTANPSSTALGERAWLSNPTNTRVASWHLAVDHARVIEAIPLNELAWHAGDFQGNNTSIGIEICEPRHSEALANTVILVAQLLKQKGWGTERIRMHRDWSGKNCPNVIIRLGLWKQFIQDVENQLKLL